MFCFVLFCLFFNPVGCCHKYSYDQSAFVVHHCAYWLFSHKQLHHEKKNNLWRSNNTIVVQMEHNARIFTGTEYRQHKWACCFFSNLHCFLSAAVFCIWQQSKKYVFFSLRDAKNNFLWQFSCLIYLNVLLKLSLQVKSIYILMMDFLK